MDWKKFPLFKVSATEIAKGQHDVCRLMGLSGKEKIPLLVLYLGGELTHEYFAACGLDREIADQIISDDIHDFQSRSNIDSACASNAIAIGYCGAFAEQGNQYARTVMAVLACQSRDHGLLDNAEKLMTLVELTPKAPIYKGQISMEDFEKARKQMHQEQSPGF